MKVALLICLVSAALSAQVITDLGSGTQLKQACPVDSFGFSTNTGWVGSGSPPSPPFTASVSVPVFGSTTITQTAYPFKDDCYNVITNSGGAAIDTSRSRMILWGGGHAGTSGNELYSLNMSGTPSLTRLNNPSVFDSIQTYSGSRIGPYGDLVIDATNANVVTSATIGSWATGCGGVTCLYGDFHITGGSGCTVGDYQLLAISGTTGYINASVGSVGSTCDFYVSAQEKYPSDGYPIPRHTYDSIVYDPAHDVMIAWEGPGVGSSPMRHTWALNMSTLVWTDMTLQPGYSSGYNVITCGATGLATPCSGSSSGAYGAYDSNTGCIFYEWGSNLILMKYCYASNQWTKLNSSFCSGITHCGSSMALTATVDPTTKTLWFFGNSNQSSPTTGVLLVMSVDISSGSPYTTTDWSSTAAATCGGTNTFPTYSSGTNLNVQSPGLVYAGAPGALTAYPWDGQIIYTFAESSHTCSASTMSGATIAASGTPSDSGTYARFAYFSGIGFALMNGGSAGTNDAYLMQSTALTTTSFFGALNIFGMTVAH